MEEQYCSVWPTLLNQRQRLFAALHGPFELRIFRQGQHCAELRPRLVTGFDEVSPRQQQ